MRSLKDIRAELDTRDLLELAQVIARGCNSTIEEMFSESRKRTATIPRHAFWAELKDLHSFSYQRIADMLGVERTTVLHGIKTHRLRVARREEIGSALEERFLGAESRVDDLERENTALKDRLASLERLSTRMRNAIETLSTLDGHKVDLDLQVAS